jgi:hypothetical protein
MSSKKPIVVNVPGEGGFMRFLNGFSKTWNIALTIILLIVLYKFYSWWRVKFNKGNHLDVIGLFSGVGKAVAKKIKKEKYQMYTRDGVQATPYYMPEKAYCTGTYRGQVITDYTNSGTAVKLCKLPPNILDGKKCDLDTLYRAQACVNWNKL